MKAIELKNFISDYQIETNWEGQELLCLVEFDYLSILTDIIGEQFFLDGYVLTNLKVEYKHLLVNLCDICSYHNISPFMVVPWG
jgi:hypothetical protein